MIRALNLVKYFGADIDLAVMSMITGALLVLSSYSLVRIQL